MKLKEDVLSMVNPSTDSMLKQTHSRYALVVLASKRARELLNGAPCHVENRANKYVTNAMEEINEGKISYTIRD
ncbi:MAG: DNA-directed RNA polymerase subunit omega [Quinella sp. 3Q1]|nr:DNA-directed RNA polymerase subunit omega [Quinella sp. 3Q1]MBR3051338.1 DNA-directed RNA polymerase subunit omega [Selenomonadaceae bacterium]MBR6887366.1 DNA-directed RNA polymerase subunit omega [Selenomonadaceae bacterium]